MRMSTQWERLSELTREQRDLGRDLYFLANAVVHAQDVLQAYFDITSLTDTRMEEAEILATLKERIVLEAAFGNVPKEAPSNASHYVTSLRGLDGLAEACPKLGESIIQSVLPKLQFSTSSGAAKVGIERDSTYRNCLTISKAAADDPACLTKSQLQVLAFLVKVVEAPIGSGARQWYPEVKANGEETGSIVFRSSVLQQIRGGAIQVGGTARLGTNTFKSISQEARRIALSMFERSGLMAFNPDAGGDGDRTATVGNPIASMPGVTKTSTRLGLLDGLTALKASSGYQKYYAATPNGTPSQTDIESWLEELPPFKPAQAKRLPRTRPNITILDLHGVLVVRPQLRQLMRAVQAAKCRECNVKPPPGAEQHEVMENALQTMINALFAISGEVKPGSDIYCGASVSAPEGIKWRRVGPFEGTVSLKNPRRREVQNASLLVGSEMLDAADEDEHISDILPPNKKVVTFDSGDNLTHRLLQETRRVNVPFAHPDDDHSRPRSPSVSTSRLPQHGAAANGHAGARETRITSTGGFERRQVQTLARTLEQGDDELDSFNF